MVTSLSGFQESVVWPLQTAGQPMKIVVQYRVPCKGEKRNHSPSFESLGFISVAADDLFSGNVRMQPEDRDFPYLVRKPSR